MTGFGGLEGSVRRLRVAQLTDQDHVGILAQDAAQGLPLDELPTLAAHLEYLFHCDQDAEFEYGLDLMLRGLEAKVADGTG